MNRGRYLFYMGHPAHYHNFKWLIYRLLSEGSAVLVVARGKDVLFDLIAAERWNVHRLPARRAGGKTSLLASMALRELRMLRLAHNFKPHLMVGTDAVICHVGKLLGIKSLVVNEDDSAAVPLFAKMAFPWATAILAPECCDQSPYNFKKIAYKGYHELAYLPNEEVQALLKSPPEGLVAPYAIVRFASLHAHHDSGRRGIDNALALRLVNKLSDRYRVYISSERCLDASLEQYRIALPPHEMHRALAHAALYIGDSQTMAAEAAVMGIPGIRYNDFVGELSYLHELEHSYGLTCGIRAGNEAQLMGIVELWLRTEGLQAEWQRKREHMLSQCTNVREFWYRTLTEMAAPR